MHTLSLYDQYGNVLTQEPQWRHILSPLTNLFTPKLEAYIVIKLLPCIYCRWRQYMTKFATFIVSSL